MYPKEFFTEQFSDLSSDELLVKMSAQDLADNARAAIVDLLAQRGITPAQVDALSKAHHKAAIRSTRGTTECDYCGHSAKHRPVLHEGQRFCSEKCQHAALVSEAAVDISETEVLLRALAIRSGPCRTCGGRDSVVEVRFYHEVRSFIVFSKYEKKSALCCVACGKAQNKRAFLLTLGLGWWSFPWGGIHDAGLSGGESGRNVRAPDIGTGAVRGPAAGSQVSARAGGVTAALALRRHWRRVGPGTSGQ